MLTLILIFTGVKQQFAYENILIYKLSYTTYHMSYIVVEHRRATEEEPDSKCQHEPEEITRMVDENIFEYDAIFTIFQ